MKKLIKILTFFICFIAIGQIFGQKIDNETFCSPDTVLIEYREHIKSTIDSFPPYKVVWCEKYSKIGIRLEIGVSGFLYNRNTKDWIGNHIAPNFNFIFVYDKFNFGFRFKPFTVSPNKELLFENKILKKEAKVNPIKLDFYVGYSFDLKYLSIEPYLGVSRNSFFVINQDELDEIFSIQKVTGFINGITVNKYFNIKKYHYISVFLNLGYSIVNYKKIHNELGTNYFESSLGVAYKGFFTRKFVQKIE